MDGDRHPLSRAKLSKGVKTSPQLVDLGAGWQAMGLSTTNVERASGHHNPHLLAIVDEASGIETDARDAIESLGYERLVAIGNPIRAEGWFVDLIHQAEADLRDNIPPHLATNAIRIPSTDSPHAHLEKSPWGIADRTWIESSYRTYGGEHSFWCNSHVHALIPAISAQRLIPDSWLDYATSVQRGNEPRNHPVHRGRRIAVDLSEGVGRDDTSILVRDANGILDCESRNSLSLADAAEATAHLAARWAVSADRISYDGLGIGRDFPRHLAKVGLTNCIRYVGGGQPAESKRFYNLRTESAWHLHDRLNPDRHTDDRFPLTSRQPPFCIPPRTWWRSIETGPRWLDVRIGGRATGQADPEGRPDGGAGRITGPGQRAHPVVFVGSNDMKRRWNHGKGAMTSSGSDGSSGLLQWGRGRAPGGVGRGKETANEPVLITRGCFNGATIPSPRPC